MTNNSTKLLFLFTLLSGLMITISSNSWLSAWLGLEINLLSFIPMMSNNENIYTTEATLKYFLIQALASLTLLFIIISKSMIESMFTLINISFKDILLMSPLLMKTGAAPLHWWFPSVMEGLSWSNCFILLTIQKIAPLILISYSIEFTFFSSFIILACVIMGAIGGYNQISIRKILTYSSINHLGWMLAAMLIGENIWMIYFMIYSLLTLAIIFIIFPIQISFINQSIPLNSDNKIIKFLLFTSLLSLGGLPPFLGFFPKWIIIQFMAMNWSLTMVSIMVIMSLITLYYYLRVSYTSFIILSSELNWMNFNNKNYKLMMSTFIVASLSLGGLIGSTMITNSM
uniref:NADH-ubiquinone oxidoreductase chain 2 n=1 Tax=Gyna caffrorum TaxID=2093439 RepID=A0A2P1H7D7_9NEOP|nr:NADH dehydrogenase subunit 2 [Gyna caffrorum]